jgi:DHA1 family inner membrane transport protein
VPSPAPAGAALEVLGLGVAGVAYEVVRWRTVLWTGRERLVASAVPQQPEALQR